MPAIVLYPTRPDLLIVGAALGLLCCNCARPPVLKSSMDGNSQNYVTVPRARSVTQNVVEAAALCISATAPPKELH